MRALLVTPFVVAAVIVLAVAALYVLLIFGTPADMLDSALPEPGAVDCDGDQPGPGALVAFHPADGQLRWSRRVGDAYEVARVGSTVVFATSRGVIRGIAMADGSELWCDDQSLSSARGMAVSGNLVATISADAVVAFDATTGELRWRSDVPSNGSDAAESSPVPTVVIDPEVSGVLGGTHFWVTSGAADGSGAQRLDPADGSVVETNVNEPTATGTTTQSVEGFAAVLSSSSEYREGRQEVDLAMRDLASGIELWSSTVPGFEPRLIESGVGDAVVVVIDQTGGTGQVYGETMISAYDGQNGELLWRQGLPQTALGLFQAQPGTVIASVGTELIGFDATTGEIVWRADHGSPGRQRPWRVDGRYRDVVDDDSTAVGLIIAERRYRD